MHQKNISKILILPQNIIKAIKQQIATFPAVTGYFGSEVSYIISQNVIFVKRQF